MNHDMNWEWIRVEYSKERFIFLNSVGQDPRQDPNQTSGAADTIRFTHVKRSS